MRSAATVLTPHAGLVLCFYGLCRNALWKIDRMGGEAGGEAAPVGEPFQRVAHAGAVDRPRPDAADGRREIEHRQ